MGAGPRGLLDVGGEAVNLTVAIDDPATELPAVRAEVDAVIDERRRTKKGVQRISTVANTIFPQSLYVERLGARRRGTLVRDGAPIPTRDAAKELPWQLLRANGCLARP